MVDKPLVLRKVADLEQYLNQLQEFTTISLEDYKKDWKAQRIIERTLHMMIETCLDITGHIISDEKLRVPENYADSFRVLEENSIIKKKLLENLIKMAKFRNLIVHHYEKTDPTIVINILRNHLRDFVCFKKEILKFLEPKRNNNPS